MTNATDRRRIVELVNQARAAGARLRRACGELGIGQNTYRRWSAGGEDQRPHATRPRPAHALTHKERQAVLDVCHRPQFASLPPAQIVARLLDDENGILPRNRPSIASCMRRENSAVVVAKPRPSARARHGAIVPTTPTRCGAGM